MSSSKVRILCTEDDPDSREILIYVLNDAGYDVESTDSPAQAVEVIQKEFFDLILVDNWMPGMSGDKLTRKIRKFNLSTPILFYSGAAYESDKQRALESGAQGYLVKPNDITSVVSEVNRPNCGG
ncbi:MAG TPA: response regulator [Pyrinomonadaceae bacterium]|nr:response regulator [Pyrinomonadaceae bacterium]